jgi:hypothetical protein
MKCDAGRNTTDDLLGIHGNPQLDRTCVLGAGIGVLVVPGVARN